MNVCYIIIVIYVIAFVFSLTDGQASYDCPSDWFTNRGYCYKFEGHFLATHDQATVKCQEYGAGLLSVESQAEHSFVVTWLQRHEHFQQDWYTSGVLTAAKRQGSPVFTWQSSGHNVAAFSNSTWLEEGEPSGGDKDTVIVYTLGESGWGWEEADPFVQRAYVCKISQKEAYRIHNNNYYNNRGFGYGLRDSNPSNWEMGPHFITEPNSLVVLTEKGRSPVPAILECAVHSNPAATYKWFKGGNLEQEITIDSDPRYRITNGRLEIQDPDEDKDGTFYRCQAGNKFGKVLSNIIEITFGNLGEFSNVQNSGTRALAYDGAKIECSTISYTPAISYQWIKGDSLRFVRPQYQTYIFISNNGKLYFSEVTRNDENEYRCIAVLKGVNEFTIGTSQAPMRTSLPIPLIVQDQAPKATWGPIIQDEFIAVFPNPPVRGENVRLECFAYGSVTSPFYYSWSRDEKPMPKTAKTFDHNRILILSNAQLEDSGTYRCTVGRGGTVQDTKTVSLVFSCDLAVFCESSARSARGRGVPIDVVCGAKGNPLPSYRWYRNAEPLTSDPERRIKIQQNVLTISHLDKDLHDGMYQCEAYNSLGNSISTGQLRVLTIPPTFHEQSPLRDIRGPESGNVTMACQPEGAPYPTVEWFFNDVLLQSDGIKRTILGNGNLLITELTEGDRGTYVCKATNIFGTAEMTLSLDVTEGATITIPPADVSTRVNDTALLECHASFQSNLDTVYEWTFYDHPIDFREAHFSQVNKPDSGIVGLYIINAQPKHEGVYTCTVRTPFNTVSASAYLTVKGPPERAAGLITLPDATTQNSTTIMWTAPNKGAAEILQYVIQTSDEFEPDVFRDIKSLTAGVTTETREENSNKHSALVDGLNPGTSYRFRVIGINTYGRGLPSDPSPYVRTNSAAPVVAPRHLGGGGGSVGDLTIRWQPLQQSEYGAKSLSYRVYWRRKSNKNGLWRARHVTNPQASHMVVQVGVLNFYLPYEAKIQAMNEMGFGPNSSQVTVMSAEDLPLATPENVQSDTYNSTAIEVTWTPVPDNRDHVHGKIKGYQINYWKEEEEPGDFTQSIRYYGQLDTGLAIGLDVDTNYIADVQIFNSAGLGPRSNRYTMETSGFAPLHYPQEVRISSAGPNRARIWWRGISISVDEEALVGYAIWVWVASENPHSARVFETDQVVFQYIIDDIEENRLYAIRIGAIGEGGYGKKSPTTYFTTEGQILLDNRFAQTVDAFLSQGVVPDTSFPLFVLALVASLWLMCEPKSVL